MGTEQSINADGSLRNEHVHENILGRGIDAYARGDHVHIASHSGGASARESCPEDGFCTNANSSRLVGDRPSSKHAEVQQSMPRNGQENSSAVPKIRRLDESHMENFACVRQALSERSLENNHCCNEETVSWQQTKADDDEHRPKVGLLQRIQVRRQEAENRQRRGEEATTENIAKEAVEEATDEGNREVLTDDIAQDAGNEEQDDIAENRDADEEQANEKFTEADETKLAAVEEEAKDDTLEERVDDKLDIVDDEAMENAAEATEVKLEAAEEATTENIAEEAVDEAREDIAEDADAEAKECSPDAPEDMPEDQVDVVEANEDEPEVVEEEAKEAEGADAREEVVEATENKLEAFLDGAKEDVAETFDQKLDLTEEDFADQEAELRRVDPEDGNAYAYQSFLEQYGDEDGAARWAEAQPPEPIEEEAPAGNSEQGNIEGEEAAEIFENKLEEIDAENEDAVFKKRKLDEVSVDEQKVDVRVGKQCLAEPVGDHADLRVLSSEALWAIHSMFAPEKIVDTTNVDEDAAETVAEHETYEEQRHESADTTTRRGAIVRLHGLESAPQLNGLLGLCLYQGEGDRWVVHLDSEEPGRFRNVRQQNLEFVCCGGAVQPMVPQQNLETAGRSESCEFLAEPISDPARTEKRKHGCEDVQLPLAERFAELERDQLGCCNAHGEKHPKKSKLDDQSQEISVRSGAEGLVEDILEMQDEAILKRLMLASTEDLAKVVSPEAMAYVILARACRTQASGG